MTKSIGVQPVVPQHDGISGDAADLLDEAREMPGDLRIGRPIVGDRWCDRLGLPELVDLNDPRRDRATGRLPDQAGRKPDAQEESAKGDETPVPGLHARRSDALVPDLAGALIGCLGLGRHAVADGRSSEQIICDPSER